MRTNGHGKGFDMVIHESRKYGFARALQAEVAGARADGRHAGQAVGPPQRRRRLHRTRGVPHEGRSSCACCLEDTVMGKLHGLTIGLDICSTLHMEVTLDDLDWCIEQVMPANPAYLMALPTKNDPMLSYLTTAFQDHVRVREKFGYKVDDRMWAFFQKLGVIDADGRPTAHFGDPRWVYLQYRRARRDARPDARRDSGRGRRGDRARARARRVPGDGPRRERRRTWTRRSTAQVRRLYEDAKVVHLRRASRELPRDAAVTLCRSRRAAAIARTTSCTRPPARR